jgi:hypothetical protein
MKMIATPRSRRPRITLNRCSTSPGVRVAVGSSSTSRRHERQCLGNLDELLLRHRELAHRHIQRNLHTQLRDDLRRAALMAARCSRPKLRSSRARNMLSTASR